ncbi:HD domain-containing phosphohydrolase [Marinicellulosiphila megalodicopiae]|uniref:HD domain-containing phosphohydrolase n=1 Tax=Marinicellulosiphila megalodicopiae TaxID=2724896 RepID=UPI003BB03B02
MKGYGILFVDDEKNILSSLKRLTRELGVNCYFANSGQEGLDLLKVETIHIVISDMRMPGMMGDEFLKKVKEQYSETIRFLLTGQSDFQSTINAVNKGGISRFISKPWDDESLLGLINDALNILKLENENKSLKTKIEAQNVLLSKSNRDLEEKVKIRTSELQQTSDMLEMSNVDMKENYRNFIRLFSHSLQLRASCVDGFYEILDEILVAMAKYFDLSPGDTENLRYSGMLYEIGKLKISDEILKLPFTKMDERQLREFKRYPADSAALLTSVPYLHETSLIIKSHREYWNGNGYPDHIEGDNILFGSRVLSICIDYLELVFGIKTGKSIEDVDAVKMLETKKGKIYCPDVVDAFVIVIKEIDDKSDGDLMNQLEIDELRPAMKLARDFVNNKGMLLLRKDMVLSRGIIDKLVYLKKRDKMAYHLFVYKDSIK